MNSSATCTTLVLLDMKPDQCESFRVYLWRIWDIPIASSGKLRSLPNLDHSLTKGGHLKGHRIYMNILYNSIIHMNYWFIRGGTTEKGHEACPAECDPRLRTNAPSSHLIFSRGSTLIMIQNDWVSNTNCGWLLKEVLIRSPMKDHGTTSFHRERDSHQRPPNRESRWSTAHVSPGEGAKWLRGKQNPTQPFQTNLKLDFFWSMYRWYN